MHLHAVDHGQWGWHSIHWITPRSRAEYALPTPYSPSDIATVRPCTSSTRALMMLGNSPPALPLHCRLTPPPPRPTFPTRPARARSPTLTYPIDSTGDRAAGHCPRGGDRHPAETLSSPTHFKKFQK